MHPNPSSATDFIDLTAWGFIVLGVVAVVVCAGQLLYLAALIPIGQITAATRELAQSLAWPPWAKAIVRYLPQWLAMIAVLSLATAWAAHALLQRREWARKAFVILLWAGAAANLAGVPLPFFVDLSPAPLLSVLSPEWQRILGPMVSATSSAYAWTAAATALVFAALFAWSARILQSDAARREFAPLDLRRAAAT